MKNAAGARRSAPRAGERQPGEPRRPQEDPRGAFAVRQLPALVKRGYRLAITPTREGRAFLKEPSHRQTRSLKELSLRGALLPLACDESHRWVSPNVAEPVSGSQIFRSRQAWTGEDAGGLEGCARAAQEAFLRRAEAGDKVRVDS
ncbi:hypothetical protein MTO96_006893 [Rhipicephalus appendiculatus]